MSFGWMVLRAEGGTFTKQRSQGREVGSGANRRREPTFCVGQVVTDLGPLQGRLHWPREDPVQWGVAWRAPCRCFEILIRGAGSQPSARAPQWKLVLSFTQAFVCTQCLFLSVAMTSANEQRTSTSHTRCAATSLCKWRLSSSSGMFYLSTPHWPSHLPSQTSRHSR